jgi:muramoyltetrapeptide carboxypeptidase LdcA involved in peptidoglycan recycling
MREPPIFATLPKLRPGDRVAVLSPSTAAPGFAPAVREQAMQRRITDLGIVPVEYPTTRALGASAKERATDINVGTRATTAGERKSTSARAHMDEIHFRSLHAALFEAGQLEIVQADESEDFGPDWECTDALTDFGVRERTESWVSEGRRRAVTGRSWGGCFEVIDQLAIADRLPRGPLPG